MIFGRKNNNISEGAALLLKSIDSFSAVKEELELQQKHSGDSVDKFLGQYDRLSKIGKAKTPVWVNFVFVPLTISAVLGAMHVLILDKKADDSLKDKALSGLLAGLTASIGFYAGKK